MTYHRATIHLAATGAPDQFPVLPVRIVDAFGQTLAAGSVSVRSPAQLRFEHSDAPLYAQLALPNGGFETAALLRADRTWADDVTFSLGEGAPSERMAWSTVRLDMDRQAGRLRDQPGMKGAWFQLWERDPGKERWRQAALTCDDLPRTPQALQLELPPSDAARALVARLDTDTPQVITLPQRRTAVLVTTATGITGLPSPRVLVGGYGPDAEAILEFLRAGALGPVNTMLDPGSEVAHQLLQEKVADPLAATAAAYYLLRKRDWERMPLSWLGNLANWFEDIPDTPLIRASARIQRGMRKSDAAVLAAEALTEALKRGLPLYAEAQLLLEDLLAYAERAPEGALKASTARRIGAMLGAFKAAGVTFGFSGTSPDKPLSARQSFESRRERRGGQLITKAARQMLELSNLRTIALPGTFHGATGINLHDIAETMLLTVDTLKSGTSGSVPGNASKTLFLRSLLEEEDAGSLLPPVK